MSEVRQSLVMAGKKAFRYPKEPIKGQMERVYYHTRKMARLASPDAIQTLIDIAADPDEPANVRVVASIAVLDRGGVRPIDPADFAAESKGGDGFKFNPRDYTAEELDLLEAALRLMLGKREAKKAVGGLGDASAIDEETGRAIEGEVLPTKGRRR